MRLKRFDNIVFEASGSHLPSRTVTTAELFENHDELIALTGVLSRHVAPAEHATSDLLVAALQPITASLEAGAPVDRLIVATVTPDNPSPATAPLVAHRLGLAGVAAFDISAACAGAVHALDLGARCLATGDRRVFIAAGECRFRTLTAAPPGVRVLFGDGAGALSLAHRDFAVPTMPGDVVLRLTATALSSDGAGYHAIHVPAGGSRLPASAETVANGRHTLTMEDGAHVFFKAVDGFTSIGLDFLAALHLDASAIDLVIPHQPNLRILERVSRRLRIPLERFQLEVSHIGNVGGASVLIALDRAIRAGRVRAGQRILLLTAGAGYTAAAALIETDAAPTFTQARGNDV